MVKFRGRVYPDHAPAQVWQNAEHEHAGVLFSNKYKGRADLFEGLEVWKDEKFRELQGGYPVLFLSFAGVKQTTYEKTRQAINELIENLYIQYDWLLKKELFTDRDRKLYGQVSGTMDDPTAAMSLNRLCEWLYRYYGKKCIVLLDEYDAPMQEAYVNGFWEELDAYTRALFNNTFKTIQQPPMNTQHALVLRKKYLPQWMSRGYLRRRKRLSRHGMMALLLAK